MKLGGGQSIDNTVNRPDNSTARTNNNMLIK